MRDSGENNILKMRCLYCVLGLIFVINGTQDFTVHSPSGPLVAVLGGSVVLPCYVSTSLEEMVKVEWRKTDSEKLVHLFLDGKSQPEAQHTDYHDRAHFFTEEIQHGNFSVCLDDLRDEDNGVYRCKVYIQQDADKTLIELKVVEQLVSGSDESISASVGEDVTLNCSVDSHISPEHIEQVSWKKTDEDGDILVLLYQNNETLSDSSDERYRDRVEFFTDELPKGNFSLRLKRVRTEDKGVYMCLVKAGGASANATVELKSLGFSQSMIVLLTLCVIGSQATILLHWLDYYKWRNADVNLYLQTCLYLVPNITMLLASIIWHATEGHLYETIPCYVFYILGPIRLLWVTPYKVFPDKILKRVLTSHADHVGFLVSLYSVLLAEHFQNINMVIKIIAFGLLVMMCLIFIARLFTENFLSEKSCIFSLLPSVQLALIFLNLNVGSIAVFVLCAVLPCLHFGLFYCCGGSGYFKYLPSYIRIIVIILIGGLMMNWYLGNEKDQTGLLCVAGFFQALWMLAFSQVPTYHSKFWMMKILFVFGSAGLVLVNSTAVIIEVIAIAVTGKRLVGDLRRVVVPSEGLFTLVLLLLSLFVHWTTMRPGPQDASHTSEDSNGTSDTRQPMMLKEGETNCKEFLESG